ncbi:NAD-glutamate dehydrogenase OS=Streptomyces tendae OX=1932 GN=GUR47_07425 PE=4 SV=1 [Streptomyces tendae]
MDRISDLPRNDRWQSMARAAIREDLYSAHASLTADVLAVQRYVDAGAAVQGVGGEERRDSGRARTTLEEIRSSDEFDLSNLSVAMRTMRTLLRTHS